MTKKTAISLPDALYRDIERARRRAGKDRSAWIQDAASEYLKKRTKEEEIEAWLSAEERFPPTADEKSFHRWQEKNWDTLSRDDLRGRRSRATVAKVTTHVTDLPSVVLIDHRDGLPEASVISCDELVTIPKTALVRRLGRPSVDRREALDSALLFALQLR